jgi:hypothetical protein
MSFEVYTVQNGLQVQMKEFAYTRCKYYVFSVDVPSWATSIRRTNDLNKIRLGYSEPGVAPISNTDAGWKKATWHVSIAKNDAPIDPWQLWEEAGFDIADVEVVTGRGGAKPWLLSFRRRCSAIPQINPAAAKQYKEMVATTRKLLQMSLPPPASGPQTQQSLTRNANRRESVRHMDDKSKKAWQSRRSSIASTPSCSGSDAS